IRLRKLQAPIPAVTMAIATDPQTHRLRARMPNSRLHEIRSTLETDLRFLDRAGASLPHYRRTRSVRDPLFRSSRAPPANRFRIRRSTRYEGWGKVGRGRAFGGEVTARPAATRVSSASVDHNRGPHGSHASHRPRSLAQRASPFARRSPRLRLPARGAKARRGAHRPADVERGERKDPRVGVRRGATLLVSPAGEDR